MRINKKEAFTLIELVIVVAMIWILIMATTVYLGWSDEKRKTIEAQWCAASIWWKINNFIFYTLTSKKLKISSSKYESPNYYIIQLTWWTSESCLSWDQCNKIIFSYSTWENPTNIKLYETVDIANTCQWNNQLLVFYRSWWNIKHIIMSKWLSPRSNKNSDAFYLSWDTKRFTWDIIIWLCLHKDCTTPKEIWKFAADARPQTVTLKNCRFYEDTDWNKCKEREQ